jgi:hypothetical protein
MEQPPAGGFRIVRDAAGVPGLLVAYEAFSEAFEQRLFQLPLPFWRDPQQIVDSQERPQRRVG